MAKAVAVVEQPITAMDRLKTAPARLSEFLNDVRSEMKKVISPSQAEVKNTTIVVIGTVFVFAVFFAIVDSTVAKVIELIFNHLAKT
jgi:preprotein translocase subunit SecE